ncbi:hypothetical protein QFZ27_003003 [Inquilinus ginsengisoli]|uniref:hypothetical protein n=1 Tax=Inquilinus ginsengisoli TaxID=363840 RepID=UPI003D1EF394
MSLITDSALDIPSAGAGSGRVVWAGSTGNRNIDGLLDGYKWSGDSITVAYPGTASAYGSGYSEALHGFRPLTGPMIAAAGNIFTQIMSFTNLRITEGSA